MSKSWAGSAFSVAMVLTWVSYLLIWLCFPSKTAQAANIEQLVNDRMAFETSSLLELVPRPDGVVFVSHASSGPARDAIFALSRFGYQVLVGVKNKVERRSFLYSLRKGIELIDFDIGDPSTYPSLVHRLRYIRRDLDRPVVGVLINLADELTLVKAKPKDLMDITYLEERYKAIAKNPFRIVQALLELNRRQVHDEFQSLRTSKSNWLSPQEAKKNGSLSASIYPWNSQGFRLTILTRDYEERLHNDPPITCDLDCLQQELFIKHVQNLFLPASSTVLNATVSIVESGWSGTHVRTAIQRGLSNSGSLIGYDQGISWAMDDISGGMNMEENIAGNDDEIPVMRAILHSFISKRPRSVYDAALYKNYTIPLPPFPK